MTLDELVVRELGAARLQMMRDAIEKAELKERIVALETQVQQAMISTMKPTRGGTDTV